jgi:hypothetical protein
MTVIEEIQQAMEKGASTMFLVGLLRLYKIDPLGAQKAIAAAGEQLRIKREWPKK